MLTITSSRATPRSVRLVPSSPSRRDSHWLATMPRLENIDTDRETVIVGGTMINAKLKLQAGGAEVAWIETMSALEEIRAAAKSQQ